ncbi:EG45-like domain containing protein [Fagus crenata]
MRYISGEMEVYMQILMIIGTVARLLSVAYAVQGTATFYDPPYVRKSSTFYGNKDFEDYVAAASNALWANGTACGKFFAVRCIGGTNLAPKLCVSPPFGIAVRIVEYCPRCGATINLAKNAFVAIADPDAGKVKINYEPYLV